MTAPGTDLDRFRLLATCIAGRSVEVAPASAGRGAYTDGRVVFVSARHSVEEQRREVVLQSALLGAGSLDEKWVRALRARPSVARRYLALEGRRVLAELAERMPLAAAFGLDGAPATATIDESLGVAKDRSTIADPPPWFGVIRPTRLLGSDTGPGTRACDAELRVAFDPTEVPESDEQDDDERSGDSAIVRLFENPLFDSQALLDYFRTLVGSSRSPGDGPAGADARMRSVRKARTVGAHARPVPARIRFTDDGTGAAVGVGGARYPEWDVHNNRYRPEWCRVIDFPLTVAADISAAGVARDDVLRRRLARVALGLEIVRRRPDGDELDLEALVDLYIDRRCGLSPSEDIYVERRTRARDLGVLVLLDASGSATDTDANGRAVHDHQRRAAATLAVTLEELGDRVAVYAFRSNGRHAVQLPAIKTFGQQFSAIGRAQLNQLEPSKYTRLGAGIRGAGDILKHRAGTDHRLLIVLSDGFPYDDGYEGRYAEADTAKAVEELRTDGLACLCLSLGGTTTADSLEQVFGSATHAAADTLSELSPRMDELFLSALASRTGAITRSPHRAIRSNSTLAGRPLGLTSAPRQRLRARRYFPP